MRPVALALAASLPLLAPTPAAAAETTIYFQSGERMRAEVLADDGAAIRILDQRTGVERVVDLSALTSRTRYKLLRRRLSEGSAEDQLVIAEFALGEGLVSLAKRHYHVARYLDPERSAAVDAGLERAEAMKAAAAAAEPKSMLMAKDVMGPLSSRAQRALAQASERLDRARDRNRSALLQTRSSSRAQRSYRAAHRELDRALATLDRADARRGATRADREAIAEAREGVLEARVRVTLDEASLYLVQQSYREALVVVNAALAHRPSDERLLRTRTRIEDAVAASSIGVVAGGLPAGTASPFSASSGAF